MDIRVTYEYSHASDPLAFIGPVPGQLVADIPANIARALLPEYVAALILQRSPTMGKLRNLKILCISSTAADLEFGPRWM